MTENQSAPNKAPSHKPILVISSHVMLGAVGNRAAAFALERLGHPVWEVPTIILPWHPGHGPSTRTIIDATTFAQNLDEIANHPAFASLGGILSGYLGSPEQAKAIAILVDRLKEANPKALYICDPVMGEENGLYIPEETAQAIRTQLLPRADIATPNRHEFDWLLQQQAPQDKAETNEQLAKQAESFDIPSLIVTSAYPMMRNAIANLLIEKKTERQKERTLLCEHQALPNPPSGTGDMFAALFLANTLAGRKSEDALKFASSAIFEVVARSVSIGSKDLELAHFQDRFTKPMAMVNLRQLGTAPKLATFRKAPKRKS